MAAPFGPTLGLGMAETMEDELRRLRSELESARAGYASLYDRAPVGYLDVSKHGVILTSNLTAAAMLGAPRESLPGRPVSTFVATEHHAACELRRIDLLDRGESSAFDLPMLRADGSPFLGRLAASAAVDGSGAKVCRLTLFDITDLRRTEADLRRLARAVEQSPASIVITDRAGNIEYVNAFFEQTTGYTRAEIMGRNPRLLKSGLTPQKTYEELWRTISAGGEWRGEMCNRRRNGDLYWEFASVSGLKDEDGEVRHYIAVKEDITGRRRAEDALKVTLHEKEGLLRETHHRVKNNLALITSLMRLEAGRSRFTETKSALSGMQARIQSVLVLNETLYRTESYTRVQLADYLRQIATHLFQAQGSVGGTVRLAHDLEPVEADTAQAIPCGLIVNELMTNSLKHAFPGGSSGELRVRLRPESGARASLQVSDTGVGLPADFDARRQHSLGLQLVSDLTRQLQGTLDLGPGATFTVTFSPRPRDTGSIPPVNPAPL